MCVEVECSAEGAGGRCLGYSRMAPEWLVRNTNHGFILVRNTNHGLKFAIAFTAFPP